MTPMTSASLPPRADVGVGGICGSSVAYFLSEFGLRKGNLVSSRARVEIKAVDRATGKVILVSRANAVAVDISPEMAGKAAIAKAAAELTEQLVPLMVANAAQ